MRNLRLDICYDGTRYRGWQRLPGADATIQGKIEQALSRILNEPIEISGSGRTDAGVHALRQVANFHCNSTMPCEEILVNLRMYLPEDIGIYSCRNVSERFHARLNAKTKTYCYRLWNSDKPCVFDRKFVYIDQREFSVEQMQQAAKLLLGTHDFSAFCANKNMKKSTVRTIMEFTVKSTDNEIRFTVTGNGFLHNMVRILVGTLVAIGRGELQKESIADILDSRVRENAGETVPAKGLCLMEVMYE